MKSTLKDIAVWMLLWFCGWGIYYLLLAHDVNYLTSPLVCALYFSAASLTIIAFYRNVFFSTARLVSPASWFMAALSIAAALAVYILLPVFIPAPETLILRNPDMFFLRLDTAYLFSKPFEIVFQQVLIFLLAAHMTRRGLSLPATCLISCLVFGASHLLPHSPQRVDDGRLLHYLGRLRGPALPLPDPPSSKRPRLHLVDPSSLLRFHRGIVPPLSGGLHKIGKN